MFPGAKSGKRISRELSHNCGNQSRSPFSPVSLCNQGALHARLTWIPFLPPTCPRDLATVSVSGFPDLGWLDQRRERDVPKLRIGDRYFDSKIHRDPREKGRERDRGKFHHEKMVIRSKLIYFSRFRGMENYL